jgi:hypothetical protein
MDAWWHSIPPEDRSYERTDPAVFGLNLERLRAQFSFYATRFGVTA